MSIIQINKLQSKLHNICCGINLTTIIILDENQIIIFDFLTWTLDLTGLAVVAREMVTTSYTLALARITLVFRSIKFLTTSS